MTTYTSQNMGAKDLGRVNRGVNTALGIGCVYSVASFLILRAAGQAPDRPVFERRRDRHYGQCAGLHLLEQCVLHPAGSAYHLPLHHGTMAYGILQAHNTSGDPEKLRIKFDAMASHDITYVGIIQTGPCLRHEEVPHSLRA